MSAEKLRSPEKLIGAPVIEVVKEIFRQNHAIINGGSLIRYRYVRGQPAEREPYRISFDWRTINTLGNLVERKLIPEHDIGLSSAVELTRRTAQIPMIDFSIGVCPENQRKIESRLAKLNFDYDEDAGWVILNSGNSYQAYCLNKLLFDLSSASETFFQFGEHCHEVLDYDEEGNSDPITHAWWFFHRAGMGEGVLRLTNNCDKKQIPEVVSVVRSSCDLAVRRGLHTTTEILADQYIFWQLPERVE